MDVSGIGAAGSTNAVNQAMQVKLQKGALEQQGTIVMALLNSTSASTPQPQGDTGRLLNVTA